MERLPQNPDFGIRKDAFGIVARLYSEDKHDGYRQGIKKFEELGANPTKAEALMYELSEILEKENSDEDSIELPEVFQQESLYGGITALPEFDPNEPLEPGALTALPVLNGLAWFAVHYTGAPNMDMTMLGHILLGNSPEETQELIDSFKSNPVAVAKFIEWVFKGNSSLEETLRDNS